MLDSNYVGEIRMFAGTFAPVNWHLCDGATLPISQNEVLYTLLGTTYGGDGVTTFAIPDLRGRVPVHMGTGPGLTPVVLGQKSGTEQVTMTVSQMASHTHPLMAQSAEGNANLPTNNAFANTGSTDPDFAPNTVTPDVVMGSQSVSSAGGNVPFGISQPSLAVNYIIALNGIYPARN
ncbi:phage tail protein [Pedobacter roseus]|jgi:microcystin-dependent protein|uniref:Phage tail protein n=1 Tax=Pedobacter roseus TaxID=336820 RepID=A0A7G9QK98_9SPHI|nr:tail fiber protein [Pedobacter roseus]QNN43773.1 phage tail protein [Pedobacter roseus]